MTTFGVHRSRSSVATFLCLSLLMVMFSAVPLARAGEDDYRLSNVDWWVAGDEIVIAYTIEGRADETYVVKIILRRESDQSFSATLKSVLGNVGEGKFSGRNQVRWKYNQDMPQGAPDKDYYFEISVEKAGGGFPWLYVAGGAAAAGVAVALLSGGGGGGGGGNGGSTDLPLPPIRP